jgi:hypothetical protein
VRLLADAVLVLHTAIVFFIVGGLIAIWIGAWRRWRWVRDSRIRVAHLAAIVFVALESVIGVACPLTVLEDWLRGTGAGGESFVQRWLQRLLYWSFPDWVFLAAYIAFAAVVGLTFLLVPPQRRSGQ